MGNTKKNKKIPIYPENKSFFQYNTLD